MDATPISVAATAINKPARNTPSRRGRTGAGVSLGCVRARAGCEVARMPPHNGKQPEYQPDVLQRKDRRPATALPAAKIWRQIQVLVAGVLH